MLDGHIHIMSDRMDNNGFVQKLQAAGVEGGMIISLPPNSFGPEGKVRTCRERLDNLFAWSESAGRLFPCFWIDPMEEDALEQVAQAGDRKIAGFKVICNKFFPGDERALEVYRAIAKAGKPILFHSGILWDGQPSSEFNRPAQFEPLLNIEGLRFSLAHVSWPWCDECIAVYGKFLNAYTRRPDLSVEMFIDLTPGTPPIYREEVLAKLFTVGYDVADNVIFGTDCIAEDYNSSWAREWVDRDHAVYRKLNLEKNVTDRIFSENLLRFLGMTHSKAGYTPLRQGE